MVSESKMSVPDGLLVQVRNRAPKRPLTYGDALVVKQVQAARLRQLLGVVTAAMPLRWIVTSLSDVTVRDVAAHEIGEDVSGLTKRVAGGYLVLINRNNSHAHRRFTLAHELAHVIDYPHASLLYTRMGHGSAERREGQIETIANHFAAQLLMPSTAIKAAWARGLQDSAALAGLFEVSATAMRIRLARLGFLDEARPTETFFRRSSVRLDTCATL